MFCKEKVLKLLEKVKASLGASRVCLKQPHLFTLVTKALWNGDQRDKRRLFNNARSLGNSRHSPHPSLYQNRGRVTRLKKTQTTPSLEVGWPKQEKTKTKCARILFNSIAYSKSERSKCHSSLGAFLFVVKTKDYRLLYFDTFVASIGSYFQPQSDRVLLCGAKFAHASNTKAGLGNRKTALPLSQQKPMGKVGVFLEPVSLKNCKWQCCICLPKSVRLSSLYRLSWSLFCKMVLTGDSSVRAGSILLHWKLAYLSVPLSQPPQHLNLKFLVLNDSWNVL